MSGFVGDIFGAPLAAEGILAFFLESTFMGVMLFGWKRFSPRVLWFASLMVALGTTAAFGLSVVQMLQSPDAPHLYFEASAAVITLVLLGKLLEQQARDRVRRDLDSFFALQPTKVRTEEFAERLRALDADVAVVVAYGRILPKPVLDAPRAGCVNVHASLLPRWRGAAPIQRAIEAGDAQTGVTIMQMDAGLDTGAMLTSARVSLRDLPAILDRLECRPHRDLRFAKSDVTADQSIHRGS